MRYGILTLTLFLVLPASLFATVLHVPGEYPTIQAGIDAASAGDTVQVACGFYWEDRIYMKSGVCLRSETGQADCATISGGSGELIYCIDVDELATIEGFTLITDVSWTPAVDCQNSSLTFANCLFKWNTWEGAMLCTDSSPTLRNCVFSENYARYEGAGMLCIDSSPTLIDCVFQRNVAELDGGGMYCLRGTAELVNCTFLWNNAGYGSSSVYCRSGSISMRNCTCFSEPNAAVCVDGTSHGLLDNCIIAFGDGVAVRCQGSGTATLTCCDLYGNLYGDWVGCIADQYGIRGNISEDPLFCDPENEDFHLHCDSPCAPFTPPNPECDLIGAWPVGCGGTPTVSTTWGGIKAMFRE